jgi:hypothetical protein
VADPYSPTFGPIRAVGQFYSMALDTLFAIAGRPFAWREFVLQCWFLARGCRSLLHCCWPFRSRCCRRSPLASCWSTSAPQTSPAQPQAFLAEAARLEDIAAEHEAAIADGFDLTLIGRRQLRSNNSWMHNSPRLMKGPDRCTALMHPDDAVARDLNDGDRVCVASAVGAIEVPLQVSDEVRPGVVSVPQGFGHGRPRVGWRLAAANGGASVNDITDPSVLDHLTGNAAFNAVPVRVEAAVATPTTPEAGGATG